MSAMTDEQMEALIRRLEPLALSHPRRYRVKVVLLALLGNAYVGLMLLLLVVLLLALCIAVTKLKALAIKLIIGLALFLWMVLKALWVKLEPPSGIEVTAQQAPGLFALIEGLRNELKSSRFHHVLITDDYNAGVLQLPRLGIFGWPRNYLLLGLPLMKALTVEQFKSVLAHEFGHLAKGHGKTSNWIYRQRLRWSQLVDALETRKSAGAVLFKPFMEWFAPYFNAYSFPMARAKEYEADAVSARLTSPQAAAEALTMIEVIGSYLSERYWPQIYGQADDLKKPLLTPYVGLTQSVTRDINSEDARTWLARAVAEKTDIKNTHPALRDRIAALNETPHLSLPSGALTADRLLEGQLAAITARLDQEWWNRKQGDWEEHHTEFQKERSQLTELDARAGHDNELPLAEAYERARLTETVGHKPDEALIQLRRLHERHPESAMVCFRLGACLIARDDATGVDLLEAAMKLDAGASVLSCQLMRDYHRRNDRNEESLAWHKRMTECQRAEDADSEERNTVLLKDTLEPHGLSDEALTLLRQQLDAVTNLRRAYLVKKRVSHHPDQPCYVFGFHITPRAHLYTLLRVEKAARQIQESVTFPGETIIISVEGDNYRFERKLKRVHGARIV